LVEQGYVGIWERELPLDQVGSVYLLRRTPTAPLGAARSYVLCLAIPDGAYVLAEGIRPESLEFSGHLLARFLGVRLERHDQPAALAAERRRTLVGVLLYTVPVTAAIALLGLSIPQRDARWVFPTILAAIVLSQVGALLTLLYYRRRPQSMSLAEAPEPVARQESLIIPASKANGGP
jgi:hypothetical protein